jgi:hypothetical protein
VFSAVQGLRPHLALRKKSDLHHWDMYWLSLPVDSAWVQPSTRDSPLREEAYGTVHARKRHR